MMLSHTERCFLRRFVVMKSVEIKKQLVVMKNSAKYLANNLYVRVKLFDLTLLTFLFLVTTLVYSFSKLKSCPYFDIRERLRC